MHYLRVVRLTANTNAKEDWLQPHLSFHMFRYSNISSLLECTVLVILTEAQGRQPHSSPSVKAHKCSGKHTEVLLKKIFFVPISVPKGIGGIIQYRKQGLKKPFWAIKKSCSAHKTRQTLIRPPEKQIRFAICTENRWNKKKSATVHIQVLFWNYSSERLDNLI